MKKIFTLIIATCLLLVANAQNFKVGKIYYQVVDESQHWAQIVAPDNGSYQNIGTSDLSSTVTYNNKTYNVLGIGPGAFMNGTVSSLCTLPDGLIYIDNGAFDNCEGGGIRIPDSMQFISDIAFVNNKLGYITCRDTNPYFARLSMTIQNTTVIALTNKEGNRLLHFPGQKLINIGSDGTNNYVSNVTIPDQITEIGPYSFYGNPNLTNVTFHNGITKIEDHAFANCKKLTSVRLTNANIELGPYIWSGCDNVSSVSLPQGIKLSNHDFYCCSIVNLTIPEGVTEIPMMCFAGNELKSVSLPESLEKIDSCGFQTNPDLVSIDLKNVKRLEHFAFMGCTGLKTYTCNGKLEYMSTTVFANTGLEDAQLPEGLLFMDGNTFFTCSALQTITIPSTVETIVYNPVTKCPKLKRVQVAEGSTRFAELDSCLYEINENGTPIRLVSVPQARDNKVLILPDGVTTIARQAARAVALTEVILPATMQTLYPSSFSEGSSISRITCLATVPPEGLLIDGTGNHFAAEAYANATLYVPASALDAYKAHELWQKFQHIEGIDTGDEPGDDPVLGDLDGDGKVDVSDVNIAINIILGADTTDEQRAKSDLNGDGKTDVSDVNSLINIILKTN
ncbi:MAG: leucine-rich repeat protein [Muribaculaceae bacterium]|nr:leucine-rich repeat protein [Muribaculaceae bacterium]